MVKTKWAPQVVKELGLPDREHEHQPDHQMETLGEVLAHLESHRDAGHKVPQRAFDLVHREMEESGPDYHNPPMDDLDDY